MNTRRQFLTRLLAAAGIPLIARALPQSQPQSLLMLPDGGPRPYKGPAIKVPSNRYWVEDREDICRNGYHPGTNAFYRYFGDWDGTFKLERGCSNPAYILADLITRGAPAEDQHALVDWKAIYDYGRYCDELVPDWMVMYDEEDLRTEASVAQKQDTGCLQPRFTVNTVCRTAGEADGLRDNLRMRFICWKATDPRYRRSFPVYT
jgi:hypothetical protein